MSAFKSNTADSWKIENCSVMGHWRKAALLVTIHDNPAKLDTPSSQYGCARDSNFHGFRGLGSMRSEKILPSTGGRRDGWGFAGTDFINCEFRGLTHPSGVLATSAYLTTPFASPSAYIEMGGHAMRRSPVPTLHYDWSR